MFYLKMILLPIACFPGFLFSNPDVTVVRFGDVHSLIVIRAEANGGEGIFILDTGAPEIILNQRFFDGKLTNRVFYGANGSSSRVAETEVSIDINGFEKEMEAIVTDFSEIERITELPVLGVIGNSMFSGCEIVIDYIFKELTIYRLDKNGNPPVCRNLHSPPAVVLPYELKGHMPCVQAMIGDDTAILAMDTGAGVNLFDNETPESFEFFMQPLGEREFISFGNKSKMVKAVKLGNIRLGDVECPLMKTYLFPLKQLNRDLPGPVIDGVLGYRFFSRFRVAFNFVKQEVHIWQIKTVREQFLAASSKLKASRD